MLATLEQNGVRGGRWYSLYDKIHRPANLVSAFREVARNRGASGVDHVSIDDFETRLDWNLATLEQQLREGTYRPQAIRRVLIPKPGTNERRPLGIPTVRDRTAQAALRHVLEPILERRFAPHSYGFRPGRGCKDALRRVQGLIREGYKVTVDVDLKAYFDTIPHDRLLAELRKYVSDSSILGLVEKFLQAEIMDELKNWTPTSGAPQGAIISPLLSNLYLDELDHLMAASGYQMTRYADDLVIQCRTREEAEQALAKVAAWTAERGLTLHPAKTKIVHVDEEGFEFLGYLFRKHYRVPRGKSLKKVRESIHAKTRRSNPHSLSEIIANLNRMLRGWFGYFKHSLRNVFRDLDGYVRNRLRAILRRRRGGRGHPGVRESQDYPNEYFAARGLYSLKEAHARACQPCAR
jgi:RNA-directed DNA polymerase